MRERAIADHMHELDIITILWEIATCLEHIYDLYSRYIRRELRLVFTQGWIKLITKREEKKKLEPGAPWICASEYNAVKQTSPAQW